MMSQNSSYSEKFITNVLANTPQKESAVCVKHTPQRKNIIILMVESFSLYQSKFFSGINDWTPNIDAIAEKNVSFTNFYANGFITEDGELAILTGRFPLYGPYRHTITRGSKFFRGYYDIPDALPRLADKKGYVTEFITSADLGFSDTGNWAKSIGFNYTEGHEHPYYNSFKRYNFKAAPDSALYDRVLERVHRNQYHKPYLLFVKTVSTHHPYINPENENYSESEAFRYADRQVGVFYRKLFKSGFFKDGILVIVGDHHAMVPLKQEEIEQFGAARAAARIPLVICYGDKGGLKDERAFQQVDLCNSLKNLISDTQCTSDWTGDLLNTAHSPARYIIFRRGDRRDIINIFYEDRDLRIQLDGDKTRMINSGDLDRSFVALFVNKINRERIVNLQQSAKK
jgi:phosphoglycerol transferase MdoB-like AlkP superfamily enzyme